MQDRFKFRVWEKDQKIMKECAQITLDKDQKGSMCDVKGKVTAHLVYQPHYVLMQCTGLKDKNGKLIYEGDICEYEFEEIGKQKAIIEFNKKYAAFLMKPLNDFQYANMNDCEVFGNIYENPELLKECKNV